MSLLLARGSGTVTLVPRAPTFSAPRAAQRGQYEVSCVNIVLLAAAVAAAPFSQHDWPNPVQRRAQQHEVSAPNNALRYCSVQAPRAFDLAAPQARRAVQAPDQPLNLALQYASIQPPNSDDVAQQQNRRAVQQPDIAPNLALALGASPPVPRAPFFTAIAPRRVQQPDVVVNTTIMAPTAAVMPFSLDDWPQPRALPRQQPDQLPANLLALTGTQPPMTWTAQLPLAVPRAPYISQDGLGTPAVRFAPAAAAPAATPDFTVPRAARSPAPFDPGSSAYALLYSAAVVYQPVPALFANIPRPAARGQYDPGTQSLALTQTAVGNPVLAVDLPNPAPRRAQPQADVGYRILPLYVAVQPPGHAEIGQPTQPRRSQYEPGAQSLALVTSIPPVAPPTGLDWPNPLRPRWSQYDPGTQSLALANTAPSSPHSNVDFGMPVRARWAQYDPGQSNLLPATARAPAGPDFPNPVAPRARQAESYGLDALALTQITLPYGRAELGQVQQRRAPAQEAPARNIALLAAGGPVPNVTWDNPQAARAARPDQITRNTVLLITPPPVQPPGRAMLDMPVRPRYSQYDVQPYNVPIHGQLFEYGNPEKWTPPGRKAWDLADARKAWGTAPARITYTGNEE